MIRIFKTILLLCALLCFIFAISSCGEVPRSTHPAQQDIDTPKFSMPQAIRVIPGNDWPRWISGDSILINGFGALSMDNSNGKQVILTDTSVLRWLVAVLPDSFALSGYADTLRLSNDTLYISGQNYVLLSDYLDNTNIKAATFVIAPTGTTADYNTDGTADEVQIEAAIAALPAEGGSILIREGEYNISSQVDIPSTKKIKIYGVGGGTVIKPASGVRAFVADNTTQTGYGQQEELIISDMRIEGSTSNSTGIYLEDKHLSLIERMVFVGDSLTAIQLKKTNNIKITNCFFNRCQRGVYGLAGASIGDDIEDIAIVSNDFSYVGRSAIHLESSSELWQREISRIAIVGNNIEESDFDKLYKFAIYLKNSRGSTITANTITQTYRGGAIRLDGGRLNSITANVFRENGNNQQGGDTTSTVIMYSSDKNVLSANVLSQEYTDYGFTWITSDSNEFIANITELDSATTYRQFGGASNIVWSPSGGGGGGGDFDPDASIAFTGNNTHSGTNSFTNTVTITGVDVFNLQQSTSNGTYAVLQSGGGGAAGIKTYAHGGTIASPTATTNNQFLGLWSARGHNGSALTTGAAAYMGLIANQTWTSGANGTRAVIATTPNNSTSAAIRMYIDNDGDVSIGSSAPTTSAKLEITGTTGALLLPRLTTAQRDALTASAGMTIFNTSVDSMQYRTSTGWRNY